MINTNVLIEYRNHIKVSPIDFGTHTNLKLLPLYIYILGNT